MPPIQRDTSVLAELNTEQATACKHVTGRALVLAGAGSGKTHLLITRILWLRSLDISADLILPVTFSKKASEEMKERLINYSEQQKIDVEGCNPCTLHSLCLKLIRQRGTRIKVLSVGQQKLFMYKAIESLGIARETISLNAVFSFISGHINNLRTLEAVEGTPDLTDTEKKYVSLWQSYEARKKKEKSIDFNDMLLHAYQELAENAEYRKEIRSKWTYVLVDEAQDLNPLQIAILELLNFTNSYWVGDDYQSIYGFRSANPEYLQVFSKSAQVYPLTLNYRSTPEIISVADTLIKHNVNQLHKDVVPVMTSGVPPTVLQYENEDVEAEAIVDKISVIKGSVALNQIAILMRVNSQSAALEQAFVTAEIPFVVVGALPFTARKEVRIVLDIIKAAYFNDLEAFSRVYYLPPRYLGKVWFDIFSRAYKGNIVSTLRYGNFKPFQKKAATLLANQLLAIDKLCDTELPVTVMEYILKSFTNSSGTTITDALNDDITDEENSVDNDSNGNLKKLHDLFEKFGTINELFDFIERLTGRADKKDDNTPRVQILTTHKAKGLEWDTVFVVGFSHGLFPHHRSDDLEEDRRLAYVAMTRASKTLFLSKLDSYLGRNMSDSQFIEECGISLDNLTTEK